MKKLLKLLVIVILATNQAFGFGRAWRSRCGPSALHMVTSGDEIANKIFIGNVPFDVIEDEIASLLTEQIGAEVLPSAVEIGMFPHLSNSVSQPVQCPLL